MKKLFYFAAIALMTSLAFTACSDDDPEGDIDPPTPAPTDSTSNDSTSGAESARPRAYVINQGNYYGGVNGSIGLFDIDSLAYTDDYFYAVNGQSLGDSPQGAILYGSKIYVPMYGSDLLWVLNASTLEVVASVATNDPEGVTGAGGYVFVTNNDGYVSQIDTASYQVVNHVEVGPNPANITTYGNYVYASISDGYNYSNSYADGRRVAVIDAQTGEVTDTIGVGMNPGQIVADSNGNLFVLNRGDYYTVMPTISVISAATNQVVHTIDFPLTVASGTTPGAVIATDDVNLYILSYYADYYTGNVTSTLSTFSAYSGTFISTNILGDDAEIGSPVSIDIDNSNGNIYICSDVNANGYAETGRLHIFNAAGERVTSVSTGIHPCGVVFKY